MRKIAMEEITVIVMIKKKAKTVVIKCPLEFMRA